MALELRLVPPTFFTKIYFRETGGHPGRALVWVPADDFGPYARRLREGKNLSLRQAAERIGVSHPFVSQIERGVAKSVQNYELLERMAYAYDADVREVLEAAGARFSVEDEGQRSAIQIQREQLERLLSHPRVGLHDFDPADLEWIPDRIAELILTVAKRVDWHSRAGGPTVPDILLGEGAGEP
jgi:transcriptional regulator with XRE-family HTH domain